MTQLIDVPGQGVVEFPAGMSDADIATAIQRNSKPAANNQSFGQNLIDGLKAGGKDLGYGIAQRLTDAAQGGFGAAEAHLSGMELPSEDYQQYKQNLEGDIKTNRADPVLKTGGGKIGNFVAKAAPAVAATFIPGMHGLAGSAAIGAATGIVEPTVDKESPVMNTLFGGLGGAGGYGLGKGIGYLGKKSIDKAASLFSPERAATLQAAKDAGYVFPKSEVNPTFFGNILESIGGKAATRQQAAKMNQGITNRIVAADIGLPSVTSDGISSAISKQTQPYVAVANISPEAKAAVDAWRGARAEAKAWWKSYGVDFHPEKQAMARSKEALAKSLEGQMDDMAIAAGKPELVPQLLKSRVELGKIGTVERSFNDATGDVSQRVLGKLSGKGAPLSGGMKTAGQTARVFPSVTRDAASVPSPGVSKLAVALPYLAAGGLGAGGAYGHQSPYGAAYAALPLLASPAARALILSKAYQSMMVNQPTGSKALQALGSQYGRAALTGAGAYGLLGMGQ